MLVNMKEKSNRGITLVALVITIVILLILAGISIQAINNTGLFANAKKAKEKSMEGQLKEEISLAIQSIQVEEISKGNGVTLETLAGGRTGGIPNRPQRLRTGVRSDLSSVLCILDHRRMVLLRKTERTVSVRKESSRSVLADRRCVRFPRLSAESRSRMEPVRPL